MSHKSIEKVLKLKVIDEAVLKGVFDYLSKKGNQNDTKILIKQSLMNKSIFYDPKGNQCSSYLFCKTKKNWSPYVWNFLFV